MFKYREKREAEKKARALKEAEALKAKYRPIETIEKEYHEYARVAGDRQYRIKCFEAEIQAINEKMFDLNNERDASVKFFTELEQKPAATPIAQPEQPISPMPEATL